MRLQLTLGLVALLGARSAHAEPAAPEAVATLRIYADDDHVTVVSPSARVVARVGARTQVTTELTADALSAASVDVVTAASPTAIVHEQRLDLGVTAVRERAPGTTLGLGARASHEFDYDAVRALASARTEVGQRSTTLELRYQAGHDIATATRAPAFRRTRDSHQLMVLVGQLLGPRTVLDVIGEVALARGYHASPYRRVALEGGGGPLPRLVAERTPTGRTSAAFATRLRHALTRALFASALYCVCVDDWAMASHTLTVELVHQRGPRWRLGAFVRGYVQGAAAFYAARYDEATGTPARRTRDRTLGPMRSAYAAVTADAALAPAWHLVLALGGLASWFPAFPAQAERRAVISTVSLSVAY